jgi:serine/threonine protein kinase
MLGREGQVIGRLMHKIHPNIGIVLTFLPAYPAIAKPWVERSVPSFEVMVTDDAYQTTVPWLIAPGIKVTNALHHVHRQRIVHRDIKPGNILLDAEDAPILIDFDIASTPDVSALLPASAG